MTGDRLRAGARDGTPYALASAVLAMSFGVVAREQGLDLLEACAMSLLVFAGSAQFAAVGILGAGGGPGAAVAAAALMNSRFFPMGVAIAPSLVAGPALRALQGQAVVDSSWAMALGSDGRFDRHYLWAHSGVQWVGWQLGTLAGALAGDALGDARALGLDAVFPAFFVAILLGELRDAPGMAAAAGGVVVALVLLPFTPPGVPILAASAVALIGLSGRAARA